MAAWDGNGDVEGEYQRVYANHSYINDRSGRSVELPQDQSDNDAVNYEAYGVSILCLQLYYA